MDNVLKLLDGNKTYVCAVMVILIGAAKKAALIDEATFASMSIVFIGLMGASMRHAVGKKK